MIREENFGQTDAKSLSNEWEIKSLDDESLVELIMGQSPPSSTYNKEKNGLPFLQGKMEFGEIYPSPTVYCSEPVKVAEKNDILISVRAPVGEVNISPSKVCIGRGLAAIRCKSNRLSHSFLFYYFKHNSKRFEAISTGSTFKAVRKNDLESFELPIPPLPEQKKIAEILSTVDKAIEKVDEDIEKTQRLKRGLMQELLTGRWNPVDSRQARREFKQTEIGNIPKEWEVVKIKNLGKVITGKTPATSNKAYWNGDVPFVTPADMGETNYVYKTERYVSEVGAKRIGFILPKDAVLVVCIGSTIGKTGLTYTNCITNQQINTIICSEGINSYYVYYAITFKNQFLKSFSGTAAVPIIKKSLFEIFRLSLPSLPEQKKIAEILSTVDKRLELLRKKREKLVRVKKGLMNDLLSGKRRVKISSQ
ncbi:MAG TPA: restriction endonuclease subunit S [Thermodesulfobacteriota bacterium]